MSATAAACGGGASTEQQAAAAVAAGAPAVQELAARVEAPGAGAATVLAGSSSAKATDVEAGPAAVSLEAWVERQPEVQAEACDWQPIMAGGSHRGCQGLCGAAAARGYGKQRRSLGKSRQAAGGKIGPRRERQLAAEALAAKPPEAP